LAIDLRDIGRGGERKIKNYADKNVVKERKHQPRKERKQRWARTC